jgi:peptide/nickel transport system substrate-binding protein
MKKKEVRSLWIGFSVIMTIFALTLCLVGPAQSAPVPAGTVVVGMSSLHEETFLPWNGGAARKYYLDPIYEYLIYLDPETRQATPGLATKWEMSKDGMTWTFWIRQGVQFHEGYGELTSEDVKYSLERLIDPKSVVGPASTMRRLVKKVEAPEKYKVVVNLNMPDIEFDFGYMSNGLCLQIVSKKYLEAKGDETANAHPIGTGAFTLVEHKKGVSVKLKAIEGAEKHWRVKPDFQNITFLVVPEESTRIAMLKTGEVDLVPINYDSIDSLKASGLNVFSVKYNWVPIIRLGGLIKTDPKRYNPNAPWADKRVRQALNYAVDKEAIVKNIFRGEAKPAASDIPAREFFDVAAYPYDPQKAKQLLAAAGYPNGFEITLKTFTTTPGAQLPMIGEAVGMYWQAVGLKVKIEPTEYPSLRQAWTGGQGKANDYVWTHRGLAFTNTASGMQTVVIAKSVFATYVTEETEAKMLEVDKEVDVKKRSALLKKFCEYLRDEAAHVFLVFANEPYGASKKLAKWPTLSEYATNIDLITRSK